PAPPAPDPASWSRRRSGLPVVRPPGPRPRAPTGATSRPRGSPARGFLGPAGKGPLARQGAPAAGPPRSLSTGGECAGAGGCPFSTNLPSLPANAPRRLAFQAEITLNISPLGQRARSPSGYFGEPFFSRREPSAR